MDRGMQTQDVSKKGLKFGDEDEDQAEKKELAAQKIAFGPLIEWLKKDLKGQISDGESIYVTSANRQSFSQIVWCRHRVLLLSVSTFRSCSVGWLIEY
jgi:hypothetical protein